MTHVAGAVFVGGTSCASTNPVHVLVAFGGVLCKIDPGAEHAADVGVALVKALMNDGVDEGRAWRENEKLICIKIITKHRLAIFCLQASTVRTLPIRTCFLYGNLETFQHNLICFGFKKYNIS